MLEYDPLEGYRDPEAYDVAEAGYEDDYLFIEQWAHKLGGPVLDVACGTGTIAIRLAAQGYQVAGVDIMPEMVARATQKAAAQGVAV